MKLQQIHLGICPNLERIPTIKEHGRFLFIKIGTVWKEQILREFPPPTNCYIRLELSLLGEKDLNEVKVYFDPDDKEALAWATEIEFHCPSHWDNEALDELIKLEWLSAFTRKK